MAVVRGWRRTTWLLVVWTGLACVGLVTTVSRGGPPGELIQDCVDAGFPRDFCQEGMDRGYGPGPVSVLLVWLAVSLVLATVWLVTRRRSTGAVEEVRGPVEEMVRRAGSRLGALWLVYQLQISLWPEPSGPDGPPGYEVFLFFVPRDGSQANFLFDIGRKASDLRTPLRAAYGVGLSRTDDVRFRQSRRPPPPHDRRLASAFKVLRIDWAVIGWLKAHGVLCEAWPILARRPDVCSREQENRSAVLLRCL